MARKDTDERSFRQLFVELVQNSSAHGIPNAGRAKTKFRTVVWSIIFVIGVAGFLFQFSELFIRFIDFPVTTNVDVTSNRSLVFPAVTICNQNPVRVSALEYASDPKLRENFDDTYEPSTSSQAPQDVTGNTAFTSPDMASALPIGNPPPPQGRKRRATDYLERQGNKQPPSPDSYNGPSAGLAQVSLLTELMSKLSIEERIELGHQAQDFIVNCTWQGESCSSDNFTVFNNPVYGNCFTFNGKDVADEDVLLTNFPGPLFGLSLQLFIEQGEYLVDYTEIAGVRIVIHDRDKMPFPEDTGYTVPPGDSTSLGVRRVEITRKPYPYSNCVKKYDSAYSNGYSELYGVGYSVQACMKDCYQRHVIERCQCADPYYPFDADQYQPCSLEDSEQMYCKAVVEYEYSTQSSDVFCDCPQPCSDTTFMSEVSAAAWPAKSSMNTVFSNLRQSSDKLAELIMQDLSTGNGAISENLLRIDVYYQELNFETIYAEAAYVWSDLGSDFGGLIGLWIGVSILTCFEFIEFLIDLASLAIARGCARPKKSKPRDPKFSDHSKDVFYLERRQQVSGTASPYWSNAIERYDSHYNQRHRAENRVMPYKQPFQQGTGRGDQSYSYY